MNTHSRPSGRCLDECYDTIAEVRDEQDGIKDDVKSLRKRIRFNDNAALENSTRIELVESSLRELQEEASSSSRFEIEFRQQLQCLKTWWNMLQALVANVTFLQNSCQENRSTLKDLESNLNQNQRKFLRDCAMQAQLSANVSFQAQETLRSELIALQSTVRALQNDLERVMLNQGLDPMQEFQYNTDYLWNVEKFLYTMERVKDNKSVLYSDEIKRLPEVTIGQHYEGADSNDGAHDALTKRIESSPLLATGFGDRETITVASSLSLDSDLLRINTDMSTVRDATANSRYGNRQKLVKRTTLIESTGKIKNMIFTSFLSSHSALQGDQVWLRSAALPVIFGRARLSPLDGIRFQALWTVIQEPEFSATNLGPTLPAHSHNFEDNARDDSVASTNEIQAQMLVRYEAFSEVHTDPNPASYIHDDIWLQNNIFLNVDQGGVCLELREYERESGALIVTEEDPQQILIPCDIKDGRFIDVGKRLLRFMLLPLLVSLVWGPILLHFVATVCNEWQHSESVNIEGTYEAIDIARDYMYL
ncbi:hypothetical protein IW262DRAFT_1421224 [Armillaria fumosa]|nr:hypothetical protein IW262DRAFT_1421224 [Armillaria fumosa]